MRDCGKGCVYSVIVSFGVIVSLSFPISIVKGIFGAYATLGEGESLGLTGTCNTTRRPQSLFCTNRNASFPGRTNRHKRCLLHRYAKQRSFITKTRRIILFTNTTLNRLGFGGTAIDHFHFQAFLFWIYLAERSVGFGRREKGTQHAAKLHFSVSYEKSHTFLKDTFARFLNDV